MTFERRLNEFLSLLFRYVEKLVLVIIGALAFGGIGQIILEIPSHGELRLEDLLLMFIFVEVMAMANVYFMRREVPFTFPMFIAVTALSRLIVLEGKQVDSQALLAVGGAILLVSVAILVIRFSQKYRIPPDKHDLPVEDADGHGH